ncbi:GNAT family N-acetyltransferase [Streptomyces sp. SID8352]|uniref:GNAT family N-acetyltransferase n=1 Tax=Streptomyces sp. SID8352 TaxID=2690338 RepID=UPI00136F3328|nr:GNAT family N-acetyltransferase [Streptomyces sp. SID8352]MYU20484.1 GNAT family N-acetyltransferase [Streptomyces sp. SID8352]
MGEPRVRRLSPAGAAARAGRIAELTRLAYAGSDPLPGLPVPDGARESEAAVRRGLARGTRIWVAETDDGRLAGALRVSADASGGWEVHRVCVDPAHHGRGLARRLVAGVEAAALAEGVPRLWLNAVVERCLPGVYARMGFRAVRHWSADDKPLSETTLERVPGAAHDPSALPLADRAPLPSDVLVGWLSGPAGLLAVVGAGVRPEEALRAARHGAPGAFGPGEPVGVDLWEDAPPDARRLLTGRLTGLARPVAPGAYHFAAPRERVGVHLMPRTLHPRLRAVLRLAPGREPSGTPTTPARDTAGVGPS